MSGLNLTELREAVANQLRDNVQTDREVTVKPYPDGKATQGPVITIWADPDYVDPWQSFGANGLALVRLMLRLDPRVGTDIPSAHRRRDDFLSIGVGNPSSILDALMVDTTLGLTGCNVHGAAITVDDTDITAEIVVEIRIYKVGAEV
jgi:hypothetical protein